MANLFSHALRYCNFFSLDAVVLALLWQELLARSAAVTLGRADRLLLGLSVWSVYILDHLLDATSTVPFFKKEKASLGQLSNQSFRHRFVKKHEVWFIFLLVITLLSDLFIARQLPRSIFLAGLLLGGVVFFYLCANFFLTLQGRWFQGREVIIALVFVGGCALVPLMHTASPFSLVIPMSLLSLLALLNCLLIARMEVNVPLASLWPKFFLSPEIFFLFAVVPVFHRRCHLPSCFEIAVGMSFAGLACIPSVAKKAGYEMASFATDGALILGAAVALLVKVA